MSRTMPIGRPWAKAASATCVRPSSAVRLPGGWPPRAWRPGLEAWVAAVRGQSGEDHVDAVVVAGAELGRLASGHSATLGAPGSAAAFAVAQATLVLTRLEIVRRRTIC